MNDSDEKIAKTRDFGYDLGIREIHLLPYHRLGLQKYRRLGRAYLLADLKPSSEDKLNRLKGLVEKKGIKVIIGG